MKTSSQPIKKIRGVGFLYRISRKGDDVDHLTKVLRKLLVNKAKESHKIEIFCIFGELSAIDVIREALDKKYDSCERSIVVMFGPKIANEDVKRELISLFSTNKNKMEILILKERYPYHTIMINNGIIYEDPHIEGVKPEFSTVIENASDEIISKWKKRFSYVRDSDKAHLVTDVDEIKKLETINKISNN